jgi:hypothetical protein
VPADCVLHNDSLKIRVASVFDGLEQADVAMCLGLDCVLMFCVRE